MNNTNIFSILVFSLFLFLSLACDQPKRDISNQNTNTIDSISNYLFVGTYTKKEGHVDGKAEGIYLYSLNAKTGDLAYQNVAKEVINPSFLTLSKNADFLYTVNETGPDVDTAGTISAFRFDEKNKTFKRLNTQSSLGFAPCHISVDSRNRLIFATNYVGGKVVLYPINDDGSIEPAGQVLTLKGNSVHQRQESSHPHSIVLSPDERFAFVSDLGTDKIMTYKVDYESVKLIPAEVAFVKLTAGSGPRHFTFHPNGKFAYVINELNNTITLFEFDNNTGALKIIESISTLPENVTDNSQTADIHISPDGQFLYGSNRGHDSIAAYKIDPDSGKLSIIEHEPTQGSFPRNFMITDDGKFLYVANQNSDNIVIFKIEPDGSLSPIKQVNVKTPVCLKMI